MKLTTAAVAVGILSLVLALEYIAWMGMTPRNMRAAPEPEFEPTTQEDHRDPTGNWCYPFRCVILIEGTKP